MIIDKNLKYVSPDGMKKEIKYTFLSIVSSKQNKNKHPQKKL